MPGLCRAPRCDSPTTSRYSVYCSRHQSRLRRQGDVAQETITAADLKDYLKLVRARIEKNRESPLGGNSRYDGSWSSSTRTAFSTASGRARRERATPAGPPPRFSRSRSRASARCNPGPPRNVRHGRTGAATVPVDPGFRFQLVGRVRALADVNAGTRYDYKSNKVRQVYREMSPRAVATMGQWLADTLGGAGARLAKMERGGPGTTGPRTQPGLVQSPSRTSSECASPTTTHDDSKEKASTAAFSLVRPVAGRSGSRAAFPSGDRIPGRPRQAREGRWRTPEGTPCG